MKAILVYNPNAGRRRASQPLQDAVQVLEGDGWSVQLRRTSGPGDACAIASSAALDGADAVFAAGGDGTLNEAVQGVAGTGTALGYLPLGTVNVWARELGIPLDPAGAARSLAAGEVRQIDLGVANDRYFLLMAGLGLDGAVVARAGSLEHFKHRFGILPYVAAGAATVPRYWGEDLELRYDGIIRRVQAIMLVVGNTRLYGGRWYFTPHAVANDGWLDLCIVKGRGPLAVLRRSLPLLLTSRAGRSDVEVVRVRELTVQSNEAVPYQLDGELAGVTPVDFRVAPAALKAIVPRGLASGLIA